MANTDYLYCDGKGCALATSCRRYTEGQRIKRNLHRDESQYYWTNHCDPRPANFIRQRIKRIKQMDYKLTFTLPFRLDAYDFVTLKDRLEREIRSYFYDRSINALLSEED